MQGIIKHIIAFICIIFLTHLFVSNFHKEDLVFDPVDAEDSAMFQQGVKCLQLYGEPGIEHSKTNGIFSDQRGNKKARDAKYVPFESIFNVGQQSLISYLADKHIFIPTITQNYYYLFCKEINPPPPKNCYLPGHLFS